MTEHDFVALNAHLEEVRPIFNNFCAQRRFVYADRVTTGRFPRIRVQRPGELILWLDLVMELDSSGKHFTQFHSDLPYAMGAGAYFDDRNGSNHRIRAQMSFACFLHQPYRLVADRLRSELDVYFNIIDSWDAQYLLDKGRQLRL